MSSYTHNSASKQLTSATTTVIDSIFDDETEFHSHINYAEYEEPIPDDGFKPVNLKEALRLLSLHQEQLAHIRAKETIERIHIAANLNIPLSPKDVETLKKILAKPKSSPKTPGKKGRKAGVKTVSKEVCEHRMWWLKEALKKKGYKAAFCRMLNQPDSFASHLISGTRTITDKIIREVERNLMIPNGSIDLWPHGYPIPNWVTIYFELLPPVEFTKKCNQ